MLNFLEASLVMIVRLLEVCKILALTIVIALLLQLII